MSEQPIQQPKRLDVLYGVAQLRPEFAGRIIQQTLWERIVSAINTRWWRAGQWLHNIFWGRR